MIELSVWSYWKVGDNVEFPSLSWINNWNEDAGSFMLMRRWKNVLKSAVINQREKSLSEAQRVGRGGSRDHVTLYQSILPDRSRKEGLIHNPQAENLYARTSKQARFYELDERRQMLWTNNPCKEILDWRWHQETGRCRRANLTNPAIEKASFGWNLGDAPKNIWDDLMRCHPRNYSCLSLRWQIKCYSEYRLQKEVMMGKWR